jgi:hypothetical protein
MSIMSITSHKLKLQARERLFEPCSGSGSLGPACSLIPPKRNPFARRLRPGPSPVRVAPVASGWRISCPVGVRSSHWMGALFTAPAKPTFMLFALITVSRMARPRNKERGNILVSFRSRFPLVASPESGLDLCRDSSPRLCICLSVSENIVKWNLRTWDWRGDW